MFIQFLNLPPGDCLLEVQLVYTFPNLPAGDCRLEVQLVYTVSKPTCRGLSAVGSACLYGFQTYLQGTVCWRCSMCIRFPNLPAGTVGKRCSLFIRLPNIPPGDCPIEVQLVYTVSKPTCRRLSAGGAVSLYGFQTYLQGTVCWRCRMLIRFPNLPPGNCLLECSLFIRFQNLPPRGCLLELHILYTVSKPTCRVLFAGGAVCLYGFQTYLQGTVCWR